MKCEGYLITNATITICEVDAIMFYHGISYVSYIYGILLTIVFSKIINIFVRYADMNTVKALCRLKTFLMIGNVRYAEHLNPYSKRKIRL